MKSVLSLSVVRLAASCAPTSDGSDFRHPHNAFLGQTGRAQPAALGVAREPRRVVESEPIREWSPKQ